MATASSSPTASSSSTLVTDLLKEKKILHCATCNHLLLSPPIMLVEHVGNLCSTCYNENFLESKCLQNTALEQLIMTLSYPCRYHSNGCLVQSASVDLLDHEENCRYRCKRCPLALITACLWEGFPTDFVTHFLSYHGEHVINFESNLFYLDITFDEVDLVKLLVMKNVILLLKMQLNLEKNKLCYMICNVKDDATSFDYSVKHKGNSESYIKTRSRVFDSSFVYKSLEEYDVVGVDLISIQQTVKITNRITNIFKIKTYDAPVYNIGERMLHYFECPVCKTFMKPPIFQCQSGHSICNVCKPKLDRCPTCRAPFGMIRNYSLEGLTAGVSYPCTYHELGCVISLSPAEITQHEITCPYKPYRCPLPRCSTNGCLNALIDHLQENHRDMVVMSDTNSYDDSFRFNVAPLLHLFDRRVLLAFNQIFRLTLKKSGDYYMFAAEAIGIHGDIKNIIYEVSIIDRLRPERRLIRTDSVLSEMAEEELCKKCIIFPNNVLASYSRDGVVSYNIKVKKNI